MNITLVDNSEAVAAFMTEVALRQIPYAALRTTQDLAFMVRDRTIDEMRDVFHKPTPFTLRSMEVIKGRDKTNPSSWVGLRLDTPWQKALAHQFRGGGRRYKRMEGAFYAIGILPKGMVMVPAEGCPMDSYDNPQRGFIVQLMSFFRAFPEMGYKANMTDKTKKKFLEKKNRLTGTENEYFTVYKNQNNKSGLAPGIWHRIKFTALGETRIVPVFLFVKEGFYRRMIRFPEMAKKVISDEGDKVFAGHLVRAMANDRTLRAAMRKI